MKKTLLSIFLLSIAFTGFSTTWTIINEGFEFSPDNIEIELGDDIIFNIGSMHNAIEVSQATWEANGNTPLPGGFAVDFGGGAVSAEQLTAGTHYYVCAPHASGGMKGIITVQNTTGIPVNPLKETISIYPNPSQGKFQVDLTDVQFTNEYTLEIYNARGQRIFVSSQNSQQTSINLDLSDEPAGIYFIKLFEGDILFNRKILIQ
jgi:plastocyanin